MKTFTLDQLAQGIREKHIGAERARLVEKWSRTGLLRGLDGNRRETMSQLLENQASQVLKESASISNGGASLTSSGQIQGFSNIAFPIVRRVFGGLVANELVSIQPMSLPSGLIFYLDYTYGSNVGGDAGLDVDGGTVSTYEKGQSIYNSPTGRGVQSGSLATGGMYDLVNTGYSKVHLSSSINLLSDDPDGLKAAVGCWDATGSWVDSSASGAGSVDALDEFVGKSALHAGFDPQLEADLSAGNLPNGFTFLVTPASKFASGSVGADLLAPEQIVLFESGSNDLSSVGTWGETYQSGKGVLNLRRLTRRGNWNHDTKVFTPNALGGSHLMFVLKKSSANGVGNGSVNLVSFAVSDLTTSALDNAGTGAVLTIPSFETNFGSTPSPAIPEIDIKIESIAITATTRKLRARWSPELAQDLNAYHSMDAEVELTSILSEQIALEIDREILSDLLTSANGANYYWSRAPGVFVNKVSGQRITLGQGGAGDAIFPGPQFTGTVREWYETLVETIIDVANTIHRKTLRGSANFMVTGPDVCTILESSVLYKPKFSIDSEGQVGSPFTIGAEAVGTVSNRFTVYKDPYFSRNKILVGYKGGSYLETGYVYAPYVPLIVTPTIFAQDDFTPRKGVMTRYGKKVVRSDFYGTVTILDMNII
jgi:hypothetical protein